MSLKATIYIEAKKKTHEITLSALTMKSLTTTMQRLWFSQERKSESESASESESESNDDQEYEFEITDKNNMKVEKDEDIERVFKSEFVHFNARIKQKKYIKRNDQLNIQRNHIMMNPL
ncbi:hypothetical protein RFI_32858, partial [Reticulomyxa filosa]